MSSTSQFDQIIDRNNLNSDKWAKYPEDVIPMWVADMDFDSPMCVKQALQERVSKGVFGYTFAPKSLIEAIQTHCQTHYDWLPNGAHLVHLPGLVCALHLSVRTFSEPGERIIVPAPVYYHLTRAAEISDRVLETIPFEVKENRWTIDIESMAQACAKPDAKMILLCNPHNPGGTVYTRNELEAIHALAKQHDLIVVSDEIHCDLILSQSKHIPFASLNEDAAQRSITLMAPSKTYNIAGLGYAFAVIPNSALRKQFSSARGAIVPAPNLLALVAAEAAYRDGEPWRKELVNYLTANRDYIQQRIAGTPLQLVGMEATYLAWIDASGLGLYDPYQYFLDRGVGLSPGKDFGHGQFVRLNFGCPRAQLEKALDRMLVDL